MKKISSALLFRFFTLSVLFVFSGCVTGGSLNPPSPAAPQSAQQTAQGKVKVAILLPLSGQNKALGEAMLNSAQMALFDIGYTDFELIPRDTQGTPMGANTAARSALQAGAKLILGPVFASEVRVVKPLAQAANVNMIAFSTDWALAGDNAYIMGFLPFDQVERVASFAAKQGYKNVGVVAPQNQYGRTVASTFSTTALKTGTTILASADIAENNVNLIPALNSFSRSAQGAQAVFMPFGGSQASTIGAQLTTNDLAPNTVKRLGTGLFDDQSLAADPNLSGAWFAAPSPNLRRQFEERYRAAYGQSAPRLATLSYDATALASILAKRGKESSNSPAFSKADITNPNGFSGIDGIFRFRSGGTAERGLAVLEYRNGRIAVVEDAPRTFQSLTQ